MASDGDIAGEVEIFIVYHRKFSRESIGERILKIGRHLSKLLLYLKRIVFYWRTLHINDLAYIGVLESK